MARADHESLYQLADEVRTALGIEVPVTLYQSQDYGGPGQAALYYTPGHGHVVFGGKILSLLDEAEKKALLGHELAHFKLWTVEGGDFLIADRILIQMADDSRSEPSHFHSARLYRLYTEIYADRGAMAVSESAETGISTLIKAVMGTSDVNPQSYLKQADEIFVKSGKDLKSSQISHPENFIRARAMRLFGEERSNRVGSSNEQGSIEKEIERMIEGGWGLDELDLLRQESLTNLTREVMRHFLRPEWIRTGRTLAHAKLYFSDFKPGETSTYDSMEAVAAELDNSDEKTRHYLTHLLLDFAVADRELDENGLAQAFSAAEKFDLAEELEKAARKELKLLKRDVTAIRKNLAERLEKAAAEFDQLSKKEKAEVTD